MTYKRIVIGTDGSETAAVAQRAATALAKEFDAELVVTHAVDPSGFDAGRAEEILKTAVGWSVVEGVRARGERRGGEPAEVLMRTFALAALLVAAGSSPGACPTGSPTARRPTS